MSEGGGGRMHVNGDGPARRGGRHVPSVKTSRRQPGPGKTGKPGAPPVALSLLACVLWAAACCAERYLFARPGTAAVPHAPPSGNPPRSAWQGILLLLGFPAGRATAMVPGAPSADPAPRRSGPGHRHLRAAALVLVVVAAGLAVQCAGSAYAQSDTTLPAITSAEYTSPTLTVTFSEAIDPAINYTRMHIRDTGQTSGGITLSDISIKSLSGDTITATLDRSQHTAISDMASPRIIIEGGAVHDPSHNPLAVTFDVDTASFADSYSIASQDTNPRDVAFSPDGTRMFMVGNAKDRVYQYSLSVPWDVTTASYTGDSHSVRSQDDFSQGLAFSPDGTRMFVVGAENDRVSQYDLSDPWNVTSASHTGDSSKVTSQANIPADITFSPDGTRMFMVGVADDRVYQYTLTTPWNITTASYDDISHDISQDIDSTGVAFSPDGSKMFVTGYDKNRVYQYSLSDPWNVATVSYDDFSLDISSQDTNPEDVAFSPDGTRMFVVGRAGTAVSQYDMGAVLPVTVSIDTTPPRLASAEYDSPTITITFSENIASDIDYAKIHIRDAARPSGGITIHDIATKSLAGDTITATLDRSQHAAISGMSSPWLVIEPGAVRDPSYNNLAGTGDVKTATFTSGDLHRTTSQDSSPQGVAFSTDGTKMFVVGTEYSRVYRYMLSTPWDITTASHTSGDYHDISQDDLPEDVAFSTDGTKMFVVGSRNDRVYQYGLSDPWNITSASFTSGDSHSVRSQEAQPSDLAFSPDGRNMFVVGINHDTVFQYSLSTPWDITTASHTSGDSHSIRSQETLPSGLAFSPDGSKMFMTGHDTDRVYQYTLSTPWDVTTALHTDGDSHSVHSQIDRPAGLAFSPDGENMFVTGFGTGPRVYRYALDMAFPITVVSGDTTPPTLSSAEYVSPTLTLTFSEPLNATINYNLLHIRDTGQSSGGITLDGTSPRYHSSDTITVTLTSTQRDEVAAMTTAQLDIDTNAVFDVLGNGIAAAPDNHIKTRNTAGSFITTWEVAGSDLQILIPATGTYDIDWGDGDTAAGLTDYRAHTYDSAGTYHVAISGGLTGLNLGSDASNAAKLTHIQQWGNIQWTTMERAFRGASNMAYNATDSPDLSGVTSMQNMFADASSFDGDLSAWDVSGVQNMDGVFRGASSFNGDLSAWNTSSVLKMQNMFADASSFDGDLSAWDVSSVTDMSDMFAGASSFNQPLNSWDVSSVTDMSDMFAGASSFEQNLGKWYVILGTSRIDISDVPGVVGTIRAQNAFLDGHNPIYRMGTGDDSNRFEVVGSGSNQMLNMILLEPGQTSYVANVTASGGTVFEDGNNWRMISVEVVAGGTKDIAQPVSTDTPSETAPTISLRGGPSVHLALGSIYAEDPICHDPQDGTITDITRTGSVDTSTPGTYTVTYTCTDSDGLSASATQLVRVFSSTVRVVQNSPDLIVLNVGDSYTDPGARCVNSDGSSTAAAIRSNNVDTSRPGTYSVSYLCYDASGYPTGHNAVRWVEVVKITVDLAPVIVPPEPVTIIAGQSWVDPGIICTDDHDPNPEIIVDSYELDTSTPGVYKVYYVCIDDAGNMATSGRTVTVEAP